jgi:site-specific recombinase XerD
VTLKLKNLLNDTDRHGNPRWYYRPPKKNGVRAGAMVRLRGEPGTPQFLEEYLAAASGRHIAKREVLPPTPDDSLRWLIEGYYKSAYFLTLGPSTQRARRGILDNICEGLIDTQAGMKRRGDLPYAEMRAKHVRAIRDEKLDLPEAANGRLKALGQVFKWAIEEELVGVDPAATVDYLKGSPTGFHTWTTAEVRAFEQRHAIGTRARLALALLLYTGVRRSDVVKLGRHMEQNGSLHFVETKGANSHALSRKKQASPKHRVIPVLPELRAVIDATPSGQSVYLVSAIGRPFKETSFGNWFRDRCNEAGLKHCSAHGLRKAGAKIAAENGATSHQLMALYGWEKLEQAELYTRQANKTLLAAGAMHLIVPREKNKNSA